jgi:hypothetical protein
MLTQNSSGFEWNSTAQSGSPLVFCNKYHVTAQTAPDRILFVCTPRHSTHQQPEELSIRINRKRFVLFPQPTRQGVQASFVLRLTTMLENGGANTFDVSRVREGTGTIACEIVHPASGRQEHRQTISWNPEVQIYRKLLGTHLENGNLSAVVEYQVRHNGRGVRGPNMTFTANASRTEFLQNWPDSRIATTAQEHRHEGEVNIHGWTLPGGSTIITDDSWDSTPAHYILTLRDGCLCVANESQTKSVQISLEPSPEKVKRVQSMLHEITWELTTDIEEELLFAEGSLWIFQMDSSGFSYTRDDTPRRFMKATSHGSMLSIEVDRGPVIEAPITEPRGADQLKDAITACATMAPIEGFEIKEFRHPRGLEVLIATVLYDRTAGAMVTVERKQIPALRDLELVLVEGEFYLTPRGTEARTYGEHIALDKFKLISPGEISSVLPGGSVLDKWGNVIPDVILEDMDADTEYHEARLRCTLHGADNTVMHYYLWIDKDKRLRATRGYRKLDSPHGYQDDDVGHEPSIGTPETEPSMATENSAEMQPSSSHVADARVHTTNQSEQPSRTRLSSDALRRRRQQRRHRS